MSHLRQAQSAWLAALAFSSTVISACGGGGATGAGTAPFAWDGGAESATCAVHECLSYVTNLCPVQAQSNCVGSSQQTTSNAIVVHACFKDGSRQVITQYASSIDVVIVKADGTECLHEISDLSGKDVIKDPTGRMLAQLDLQSLQSFSCGGIQSTSLNCPDAGQINLVQLSGCEGSSGGCP